MPCGSWETPLWEDGKIIGYWLNYQLDVCDFNIGPDDDEWIPGPRFRPVGSSERIELE